MSSKIPWRRVGVEGVVIVASILLAFGIDAAWDARQEREAVRVHLDALLQEIGVLKQQAEGGTQRRLLRMTAMRTLIDQVGDGRATVSSDSINTLLGQLWGAWDPLPPLAALANLHESGVFPAIQSEALRLGLARVEGAIENAALHDERVLRSWEEGLRPYLVQNSDARPQVESRQGLDLGEYESRFRGDPGQLLQDVTFQNHLIVRVNRTVAALGEAERLVEALSNVEVLIREELGS